MFRILGKTQIFDAVRTNIQSIKYCTSAEMPKRLEKSINEVTLLGRVGADPQLRGNEVNPVVTFSVATHFNYKVDSGDWAQRTDWHRVCVFRPDLRQATLDYIKKGQRILLNGKIAYGELLDKDGNSRSTTTIVADEITFL